MKHQPITTPLNSLPTIHPDEVLTKREIAHRLRVSTRTIDQWMRSRRLPFIKLSKTVRFRWQDVVAHLAAHRVN